MNTKEISGTLSTLFAELVTGAPKGGAYIMNSGDAGLLASLDKLTADAASRSSQEGATIAAHTDHLRYGLSLMNRWATEGGNPFATADWNASWQITAVTDAEWERIRGALRQETERWLEALRKPRDVAEIELSGMVASVAHLAYHLGAMRQIARAARGPKESERTGDAAG